MSYMKLRKADCKRGALYSSIESGTKLLYSG